MYRPTVTLLILLIPGLAAAARPDDRLAPTQLTCEHLTRPLGLDAAQPRLSWQLTDTRRSARQTAYQIRVAKSAELLKRGDADVWDSRTVGSDQCLYIPYGGPKLESGRRYYWQVRVWDQDGKPGAWSAPTYWETGLLSPADWHAKWIAGSGEQPAQKTSDLKWFWYPEADPSKDPPDEARYFRLSFSTAADWTVESAYLYAAVDNSLTAWVNGKEVGSTSGWAAFAAFPMTTALHPGRNLFAIKAVNAGGPAGVAALINIHFTNGITLRIAPDSGGWKSSTTGPANWNAPEFNDSEWKPVRRVANMGDKPWGTPIISPQASDNAPYLRKEFRLTKPVKSARVYVTALGSYRLHLNGKRVGADILTPDWTDYSKRVNYQTYDVTHMLKPGENALGAMLGDGWYGSGLGWALQRYSFGPPPDRMLLQMHIVYVDGSADTVVSDESWKAAMGPILRSELYAGETYDARKEQPGWDRPGFPDSQWRAADVVSAPTIAIVAQSSPTIQVTGELTPIGVTEPKRGVYVFDMGQNMVGYARLKVRGGEGRTVKMRFAEILNPDGTIYTANLRKAEDTDTYITRAGGEQVYEPSFTYRGYRYIEVTGYPGRPGVGSVHGIVFNTNTPSSGVFASSSELVNRLQHNILWGQRGNQHSVPTDCPQRDERLGWMGDAEIFARTACYNMDMSTFYAKWMRDVVDAQSPEGGYPDVAPRVIDMSDGAPAWGDAGVIVPYEVFRQYGDTAIVRENWPAMERWLEYIHRENPNLLWLKHRNNDFGDWVPANSTTPKEVIATAYWAYDAHLMAEMARATGQPDAAARYDELYRGIKAAFIKAFVKEDGTVGNGSQTCQALAIHMELLPDNLRTSAANILTQDIENRGGHLSTGFVGTCYLMRALSLAGRNDVAYQLLLNDTFPSWGYMIRKGATTMWERWNGDTGDPGMNSYNHYAFGAVGEWLYRYCAGIDTDPHAPGYKHIIIHPRMDSRMPHARAEYDSMYGKIVSDWTSSGSTFSLNVSVPPNATATVYVPTAAAERVTESGKAPTRTAGVLFQRMEEGYAVYLIGSGSYTFAVR